MGRILPILFNEEMVRAILDGRKTVTRRVIKFPVISFTGRIPIADDVRVIKHKLWPKKASFFEEPVVFGIKPPYGIGDILYVRETWAFIPCIDCWLDEAGICAGKPVIYEDKYSVSEGCFIYREDYPKQDRRRVCWHPSIHMPKQAARIWLKVTSVRAERLQDIKNFQAEGIELSEGCEECLAVCGECNSDETPIGCDNEIEKFADLWDSTVKKADIERYGWDANPWVWVIEFERCGKPEPCILNGIEPASDNRPCIGYQKSKEDDETCEMCKGCEQCDGEESESEER